MRDALDRYLTLKEAMTPQHERQQSQSPFGSSNMSFPSASIPLSFTPAVFGSPFSTNHLIEEPPAVLQYQNMLNQQAAEPDIIDQPFPSYSGVGLPLPISRAYEKMQTEQAEKQAAANYIQTQLDNDSPIMKGATQAKAMNSFENRPKERESRLLSMQRDILANRPSAKSRALAALGANIAVPQPGTGFAGTLQSIADSMGPAAAEYFKAKDQDTNLAITLAEMQEKADERREDREIRREHEREAKRQHQESMAETRQHHRAWEAIHGYGGAGNDMPQFGAPIKGAQVTLYTKKKLDGQKALAAIKLQKEVLNKFNEETKDDILDPLNPYTGGTLLNPLKKIAGRIGDSEWQQKVRKEQTDLEAMRGLGKQMMYATVRNLKGGMPTERVINDMEKEGTLPMIGKEPRDLSMRKLDILEQQAQEMYDIGNLSVQFKQSIGADNLEAAREYYRALHGEQEEAGPKSLGTNESANKKAEAEFLNLYKNASPEEAAKLKEAYLSSKAIVKAMGGVV